MIRFLLFFVITSTFSDRTGQKMEEYLLKTLGYKDSLYIDVESPLLYYLNTYEKVIIDTEAIISYDQYIGERIEEEIKASFQAALKESLKTQKSRSQQGFIPTIEIPMTFPKGLSFLGEGGKIDIDGQQTVNLSMEKRSFQEVVGYEGIRTSSFFNPKLDQSLKLKLKGTVGTKIHILIDHDSQREDERKQKITLKYQGDEDEIVQLIEAGDTRLSLPSTRFASFPGGSKEGLFGLKTKLKLGGIEIQAVATREKGETQQGTFSQGAKIDTLTLYDRDFERFRFFYIPEVDSITEIKVFKDEGAGVIPGVTVQGYSYYYNILTQAFDTTLLEIGNYKLLTEGEDYYFYPGSQVLELFNKLSEDERLAVYYKTASGRTVGNISGEPLTLRLIKPTFYPANMDSLFSHQDTLLADFWNYVIKNIYSLGTKNLDPENISIEIYRDSAGIFLDGENNKKYLQLFGLDENGDGKIEISRNINGITYTILDADKGLLIFPFPEPFSIDSLTYPDSIIYKKPRLESDEGKKYVIKVVTKKASELLSLNQINIIENSEVVIYNGRQLTRGVDYNIDYESGTIVILNDEILKDPNAQIKVTYDYAPLFSLKQRSLWGVRFDYNILEGLSLGGSFMGRSESALDKRPRLGEEPQKAVLTEMDLNFNREVPFLTELVSKIPYLNKEASSRLRFQMEIARSYPNPNTEGDGYLDDMESTDDEVSLPISRFDWKYSSIPLDEYGSELDTTYLAEKIVWASPIDLVQAGDVYNNIPEEEKDDALSILYLELYPYQNNPSSFIGLSTLLLSSGYDMSDMEFLDVIVKGKNVKLNIDLATDISENAVWRNRAGNVVSYDPGKIADEDKNHNGQLDADEDVGLDGVEGDDSKWTQTSMDDGNDDYYYDPNDKHNFSRINGTERNGRLDTEELKVDGVLSLYNNYYEYTIDLNDTSSAILVEENANGFKHYLIPLKNPEYYRKIGSPSFENIRFARIWFTGFDKPETLMVVRIKVVGNKYKKIGIFTQDTTNPVNDSVESFGVHSVSVKDDPLYTSPPGIRLERDISGRLETEHSLAIKYNNLGIQHYGVVRRLRVKTEDFMSYKKIKFYVKPRPGTSKPYPVIFVRFGDTLNYYEHRYKITSSEWQEISIDIDELTQIKKSFLDTAQSPYGIYSAGNVVIKGNPSFTQVKAYEIGLLNNENSPISGEIWLDELRLSEPRKEPGIAYTGNLNFKLADILDAGVSFTRQGDNFQTLTGNLRRSDDRNYNISSTLHLGNLLPPQWGLRIDISGIRSRNISYPRLASLSDVILTSEQKEKEKSSSYSERYTFSYSKTSRSSSALLKFLLDPFRISGSKSSARSVTPRERSYTLSRNLSLSHAISPELKIKLGKKEIALLPSYEVSGIYGYNYSQRDNYLTGTHYRDTTESVRLTHNLRFNPIPEFSSSYTRASSKDLLWGKEANFSENLSMNLRLSIKRVFIPHISFSSQYNENSPRNLQTSDTVKLRDVTQSNNINFSIPLKINWVLEKIASLRNEEKDTILDNPFDYLLFYLHKLSRRLSDISFSYNIQRSSNLYSLPKRPKSSYRYGIDYVTGVKGGDEGRSQRGESRNLNLSGNVSFPYFTIKYSARNNYRTTHTYTSARMNKGITWPSLVLSLSSIERLIPGVSKIITRGSLSFNYEKSRNEQGELEKEPDSKSIMTRISPNLNFSFKKDIRLNISYSLNNQTTTDFRFGIRKSYSKNSSLTITLSYTFSSPEGIKIPFSSKKVLKIKSSVQTNLNLSISSSETANETPELGRVPMTNNSILTLSSTTSYSFTRNIVGSLTITYNKNKNNLSGRGTSSTQINFGATFKF